MSATLLPARQMDVVSGPVAVARDEPVPVPRPFPTDGVSALVALSAALTLGGLVTGTTDVGWLAAWNAAVTWAFLFAGPGGAVAVWAPSVREALGAAIVPVVSIAWWTIAGTTMVIAGAWHPGAGVGATAVLVLVTCAVRLATAPPPQWRRPSWVDASRWRAVAFLAAWLIAVAGLWCWAVVRVDPQAAGPGGLAPVLPWQFWAALALAVGGAVVELIGPARPGRVAGHVLVVVVVLYAFAPAIHEVARYPWTYKHVGVTDYVLDHGAVDRELGVYTNWPGFFAAAALAAAVTHQAVLSFAAWAQPVFAACFAAGVWALARALGASRRAAATAVLVFVLFDWVGQDYFAPQAAGLVLALAALALALRAERTPPAPAAEVVLYLLVAAVAATHQLTSAWLAVALVVLALARRSAWRVAVASAAIVAGAHVGAVGWLVPHLEELLESFRIGGVETLEEELGSPPRAAALVTIATRAFSAVPVLLAALGGWRAWRRSARAATVAPIVLALTAAAVAIVTDYGGEAIYRAYLFALPALGVLAASLVAAWDAPRVAHRRVVATLALIGLVGGVGFPIVAFGRESTNRVDPDEVTAAQWYYAHADPGSLLVPVMPAFPSRLVARYAELPAADRNDPYLMQLDVVGADGTLAVDVGDLPAIYRDTFGGAGDVWIVLGPSQQRAAETAGWPPAATFAQLRDALDGSNAWRLAQRVGAVELWVAEEERS